MAEGSIALTLGSPALNISVFSPTPFDNTLDSQIPPLYMDEESSSQMMSISGLSRGVRYWSAGLVLDGNPRLKGECGVRFAELGFQLKGGVECGFHGLAWFLGGNWSNETVEIDSTLNAGPQGVMYKLEYVFIQSRALKLKYGQPRIYRTAVQLPDHIVCGVRCYTCTLVCGHTVACWVTELPFRGQAKTTRSATIVSPSPHLLDFGV